MNLFLKTLKSFTRREKGVSLLLILLISFSIYSLSFSSGRGIGIAQAKGYTEGIIGEIKRVNPVFTDFSEADADVSKLVFSGLVKYNPITEEFEEDMATHSLSEDKLTYTFTLKNELYWHDQTEVSAEDLYFTFAEVIQSPEFTNPVLKSNFEGVKIELVNSRTISFTLNSPNSFFFTALTVGILPKHILGEVPVGELDTHEFNTKPIGTGPYQVQSAYETSNDGSTRIQLTKSPQYYGQEPNIENFSFVAYPNLEALLENRSTWRSAARIPQSILGQIDLKNLRTYQYELPQYTALFINTDSSKLDQNKERLGISKAINKAEILEAIGYKAQIDTPLLQLNQEDWINVSDPEESAGALFDSGWALNEETGFRENEDGETLTLRLARRDFSQSNLVQEDISMQTTSIIKEQLKGVGVELVVESYDIEALQGIIRERDFEILLYGQSLGYNLDTFSYWHSSQATEEGLNLSNYQNPKADFYIESIRENSDPEEQEELLSALAEIIGSDIPAIFLYTPSYYYLVDTNLTGFEFEKLLRPQDRFANIEAWIFN